MSEMIEPLPNGQDGVLRALDARELEAVEGGLDPEHCGTCRNPIHPSLPPPTGTPDWIKNIFGIVTLRA